MIDLLAFEPHFLDHLAPVWRALPEELRGIPNVDETLADRAARLLSVGDQVGAIVVHDGRAVRKTVRYPAARPGAGPTALVASYGDIKVGRRLGYRRFAFLEHGAGQAYVGDRRHRRHGSYAGGEDRDDVELFLVPNGYAADLWRGAYPDARVEIVGCPKLDELPAREPGPAPVVALAFHWDFHAIAETRSALGHYLPALPDLARRFRLIGHGHPRYADTLARTYRRLGIEYVPEFDEVCRRADVLVADNSSVLFEFAATGRNVVVLNAPWYRRNVEHGLRFWSAAGVGANVSDPSFLPAAVAYALSDDEVLRLAREDALRLVYTYRDGGARRAADAIVDWLATPTEVEIGATAGSL